MHFRSMPKMHCPPLYINQADKLKGKFPVVSEKTKMKQPNELMQTIIRYKEKSKQDLYFSKI